VQQNTTATESKQTKLAKSVSRGKSAVSKLVNTDSVTSIRAKTTTIDPSDEKYKESTDKAREELEKTTADTEKYYKQQYENEKDSYRQKLVSALTTAYGRELTDEELANIDKQVDDYAESLWDDVYKPISERVTKAHKQATDQVLRYLKKLYDK
jgi:F0F1-type ATP synthase membrane subunit b/b'